MWECSVLAPLFICFVFRAARKSSRKLLRRLTVGMVACNRRHKHAQTQGLLDNVTRMLGVLQGFQKRNEGRKVRSARYCGLSGRRFEYETIARSPKEGDVRVCFKTFWLMLVDVQERREPLSWLCKLVRLVWITTRQMKPPKKCWCNLHAAHLADLPVCPASFTALFVLLAANRHTN